MRRNLLRNMFFLAGAALLIVGSLFAVQLVVRAAQNPRVALSGQNVPLIQSAHLLQAADASQSLNLSIGLRPRNAADLENLLRAIYTPGSPQYHHYLTPEEFNQQFAPTSDQVAQVTSFLQSQQIAVSSVSSNHILINAVTTVAQAEQAFQVQINTYQYGSRTFYANSQLPTVPASVQALISSIGGMDNSTQYQPYSRSSSIQPAQASLAAASSGYGPVDLSGAYDTGSLIDANIMGQNQTVAIFELDGYKLSDVQTYFKGYGLATPNISNVLVDNFKGTAGQGAIEVELDMEVVGAVAPQANQVIYEGPNSTQGLNDTYNRIVTDNRAQVISTSWGLCESSSGAAELRTLDAIFQQAAAQGIAIYSASGDAGAYDCGTNTLAVDSPSDDPYVTGVGGTNLQLNSDGSYASESAWSNNSDTQRGPRGAGGGGGLSTAFTQPSWQTGPGVMNSYSSNQPCHAPSGQFCREVPDVSADADPASGYAVYCTVANSGCPSSGWVTVGGTSAAAPFWAGSTALINQFLQSQNMGRMGSANPALYSIFNSAQASSAFHDVTSGDNLFYPTTGGYDMASGMGSPDVYNLAQALAANSGGTPTPNPTPTATPNPPPSSTLIKNGGFESGSSSWQESSGGNYEVISTLYPHSGKYSAYLCGYTSCKDRLAQTFTVPRSYNALTLSYWWVLATTEFSKQCLDSFTVALQTTSGQTISTLQRSCNTDTTGGWQQANLDLSSLLAPYKGRQVVLAFSGATKANLFLTSDFFVDDVSIGAR